MSPVSVSSTSAHVHGCSKKRVSHEASGSCTAWRHRVRRARKLGSSPVAIDSPTRPRGSIASALNSLTYAAAVVRASAASSSRRLTTESTPTPAYPLSSSCAVSRMRRAVSHVFASTSAATASKPPSLATRSVTRLAHALADELQRGSHENDAKEGGDTTLEHTQMGALPSACARS